MPERRLWGEDPPEAALRISHWQGQLGLLASVVGLGVGQRLPLLSCLLPPVSCAPGSVPIQHQSCVSNASRPFFSPERPSHICKGLLKYILFQSYESCG